MNRKDFSGKQSKKVSASELRRKEKEYRKLEQELKAEKNKLNQMASKFHIELSEARSLLTEENQNKLRLQMELDAKESEIEQLLCQVALQTSDTVSVSSGADMDGEDGFISKGWFPFYACIFKWWMDGLFIN